MIVIAITLIIVTFWGNAILLVHDYKDQSGDHNDQSDANDHLMMIKVIKVDIW